MWAQDYDLVSPSTLWKKLHIYLCAMVFQKKKKSENTRKARINYFNDFVLGVLLEVHFYIFPLWIF